MRSYYGVRPHSGSALADYFAACDESRNGSREQKERQLDNEKAKCRDNDKRNKGMLRKEAPRFHNFVHLLFRVEGGLA